MNGKHARLFRRFFAWAGIASTNERRARMEAFDRMPAKDKAAAVARIEKAMAQDPRPIPPRPLPGVLK